jgi:LmbE family N-acetylglucosaminyl deacetylase
MKKNTSNTILGITAHADDHIMFAGTVMKLQDEGYTYNEAVLTKSEEGADYRNSNQSSNVIQEMRMNEFNKASELLKTENVYTLNQEDQNLTYSKELMHSLVKIIREVKPAIGISMNKIDVHPDHISCGHLATEAFRWAAKNFKPELGNPHRTPIVLFAEGTTPADVSFLVDITQYMEKKEKLFKLYDSQASSKDLELMKSFATLRGYHLRTPDGKYAEGFSVTQNILPILF